MLITREGNLVTLINVFDTTAEQQQALLDQWIRFTEEVKDEPGFFRRRRLLALSKRFDALHVG
jgi:hypothetical protein